MTGQIPGVFTRATDYRRPHTPQGRLALSISGGAGNRYVFSQNPARADKTVEHPGLDSDVQG